MIVVCFVFLVVVVLIRTAHAAFSNEEHYGLIAVVAIAVVVLSLCWLKLSTNKTISFISDGILSLVAFAVTLLYIRSTKSIIEEAILDTIKEIQAEVSTEVQPESYVNRVLLRLTQLDMLNIKIKWLVSCVMPRVKCQSGYHKSPYGDPETKSCVNPIKTCAALEFLLAHNMVQKGSMTVPDCNDKLVGVLTKYGITEVKLTTLKPPSSSRDLRWECELTTSAKEYIREWEPNLYSNDITTTT